MQNFLEFFKKNGLQFSFYLYLVCLVYVLNLFPIVILYFIIHYGTNSAYMKSPADKLYTTGVPIVAVYSFFYLISIFHPDNFYNKQLFVVAPNYLNLYVIIELYTSFDQLYSIVLSSISVAFLSELKFKCNILRRVSPLLEPSAEQRTNKKAR